ncbi:hypothetical protein BHF71_01895 [Vulcanibacillus modesticaldus]|uniref:Uncharacterized protein n=1 Tax=Vulcanibacillus modesticaldus TaxID=337097 RepID=A0A1D2YUN8_9BACI|nr:hypothetical protein [Vulcanibacillus modesticaldus]OEF99365.1 hypothetical protein BHF71_01895 [Vulcanibacillus modesticaldus]
MSNKKLNLFLTLMISLTLLIAFPTLILADPGHSDSNTSSQEESVTQSNEQTVDNNESTEDDEGSHQDGEVSDSEEGSHNDEENASESNEDKVAEIAKTTDRFIVVGGEAFVESLLNFILAVFWLLLVALQLARPYMLQLVQKFGLRLGADLWWLAYILIRDLVAILTLVVGLFYFYPMLLAERPFPIFGSLAGVFLLASLVVRLVKDPDDDAKAYILETNLIGIGSALYLASVIFGVQGSKVELLQPISKFLVSQTNTSLAYPLLWLSMIAFIAIGGYAVWFVLKNNSVKSE